MASDPTPVIPTLHAMSTPRLSRPADVASYLIGWLFRNPGGTSSMNEGEMMSYRKLVSTYGHQPRELANQISRMLETCMSHYFPNAGYTAVCDIEERDGYGDDGTYLGNTGITIVVRDINGVAVIPMANIIVDEDGDKFDIKYSKGYAS